MKMMKSDILKNMSNTANSYYIAYSRCMEQRKIDLKTFQWLPIPALTCIAFSCEVYLKTLLLCFDIPYPKGAEAHDLKKLFNSLPKDMVQEIKDSYENPLELDNALDEIKKYFITSRYFYESETASFSFPFIEWFHQKLKEITNNKLCSKS